MTAKDLVKVLEKNGFIFVSQKGSHLKLRRGPMIIIVPMHKGDLKTGLERAILKQAGLFL